MQFTLSVILIIAALVVAFVSMFINRHPLLQIAVALLALALLVGR